MKPAKKSIGVFDSGFGGLNTLRSIVKALPQYNYIYLGDSAQAPYGNRSPGEVYKFTRQAVDFLFRNNCELVVLACNTASSEALRKIQQEYLPKHYPGRRVLGVLIPAAELAAVKKHKRVGIMATTGTVKSGAFKRELTKLKRDIEVYQQGCPLLVPIVEAGKENTKQTKIVLQNYLHPLLKQNIDVLILGCTHYGILKKQINRLVGNKVKIISEADIVPKKLAEYLRRHKKIANKISLNRAVQFYSTGQINKFEKLGSKFFGKKIRAQKAILQ
ncbi:MAG: glutamate racemase [Candidatus Doudnabacteria bacterium RIFCSPHIGHO2_01_FULL_46_14]|uniref:Glutamate racemase n=1 Tax=Candidatus Doudnabacteria bacterium RIFCSPHIGHO2_01_FULL_46_14 TaxID=1817824 RepID=A0A1F5NPK9_9BACT|nr:MAG: glutamate racemase [Candidatus Doudnabacteria bacterium RIFCSPHIGHO2_01_FULL_46_14]